METRHAVTAVRDQAALVMVTRARLNGDRRKLGELIEQAVEMGADRREVADAAGLSRARITQIVGGDGTGGRPPVGKVVASFIAPATGARFSLVEAADAWRIRRHVNGERSRTFRYASESAARAQWRRYRRNLRGEETPC